MILADILQEIGIACLAWAGVMILFAQIEWIEWNFEQWSILIVISLGIGISSYVSNLLVREYGGFIENSDALRKQKVDLVSELTNCSISHTPQNKANKFCKKCGMPMDNANEANQ